MRETWIIVYNNNGRLSICTVYHTRVDARNHGGLGIFGAVVWVSFELLPFAGAVMGAVTGKAPAPPPPRSAPPPPLALGDPAVSDPLFEAAGFELCGGTEGDRMATVSFPMDDLDVALNLLRAARLGPSGGDGGVGGRCPTRGPVRGRLARGGEGQGAPHGRRPVLHQRSLPRDRRQEAALNDPVGWRSAARRSASPGRAPPVGQKFDQRWCQ